MARYQAELNRRNHAKATRALTARILRSFRAFLLIEPERAPKTLADLTPELVTSFRDHELTRGKKKRGRRPRGLGEGEQGPGQSSEGPLSAQSVAATVYVLRGFFSHLSEEGLVLLDPARDLRYPRLPKPLPRSIPSPRKVRYLLHRIGGPGQKQPTPLQLRDRAIVELLYGTGLRNGELCALVHGDVDFTSHTVHVRLGKGGKDRVVPIGRSAEEAITRYLSATWRSPRKGRSKQPPRTADRIFVSRWGTPLNPVVVGAMFRRWKKRLGTQVTAHALRHACATHLLRGGADIRHIQSLLGHASLSSTEIYTRVETGDLKRMLLRCHPRERL